jgi:hypothetical protein
MVGNMKLGAVVFMGGGLGLLLLAMVGWRTDPVPARVAGPQTLTEVAQVATQLGLYYRSERPDGRFDGGVARRLVVSTQPITFERIVALTFEAGHSSWAGIAAVTMDPSRAYDDYLLSTATDSPGWAARWGEFFLFGDPDLVRRLAEHT